MASRQNIDEINEALLALELIQYDIKQNRWKMTLLVGVFCFALGIFVGAVIVYKNPSITVEHIVVPAPAKEILREDSVDA